MLLGFANVRMKGEKNNKKNILKKLVPVPILITQMTVFGNLFFQVEQRLSPCSHFITLQKSMHFFILS